MVGFCQLHWCYCSSQWHKNQTMMSQAVSNTTKTNTSHGMTIHIHSYNDKTGSKETENTATTTNNFDVKHPEKSFETETGPHSLDSDPPCPASLESTNNILTE